MAWCSSSSLWRNVMTHSGEDDMQFWFLRIAASGSRGGFSSAGLQLSHKDTHLCLSLISCCVLSLSLSSWSRLSSQPDALQPGCVQPQPDAVSSAASGPAAAQPSTPNQRLPSPACIQPRLCWTPNLRAHDGPQDRTHSHFKHAAAFWDSG